MVLVCVSFKRSWAPMSTSIKSLIANIPKLGGSNKYDFPCQDRVYTVVMTQYMPNYAHLLVLKCMMSRLWDFESRAWWQCWLSKNNCTASAPCAQAFSDPPPPPWGCKNKCHWHVCWNGEYRKLEIQFCVTNIDALLVAKNSSPRLQMFGPRSTNSQSGSKR